MSMYDRGRRGFTLTQFLISTIIAISCIPIVLGCLSITKTAFQFQETIQDEIATNQLRKILSVSHDMEVSSHSIQFQYHNEPYQLIQVNDHLIMKPGTVIYYSNIESSNFQVHGNVIQIHYFRNGVEYEKAIGYLT